MSNEKQKEASKLIAGKLAEIERLYNECAKIAEDAQVGFSYSGPAGYGDSGWYTPKSEAIAERREYDEDLGDDWEPSEGEYGWQPSAGSC